ncbi:uncharacterized protein LOC128311599 isoform X1 [Acinonyx jubatus]|uniref:Uncharacterized protein LOC128311599 isoform X1 n=1 Tax=Acinonyx jubatus TaxID=32536 RepID=A0ABM3NFZ1_ACIJB|nr:uncharacterized protein LOC128311599 isoform X1 [Acinonyx jubatus]
MPSTVTGAHRREANLREERRPEAAAPRARGQAVPPPLPGLFILGPAGRTSSEPLRDGSRSARGPPGLPVHGTGPPARVCHTLAGSVLASRVGSCPGCSPPFPGHFSSCLLRSSRSLARTPRCGARTHWTPTAISPQHLGPTTSACQTSLPCIPNKRMGQPHYCLVWQTPVSHFRPTGKYRTQEATPLGDGEASGKPSRQRPRSAQDRGGRNRVPLGARRGPERGGCGDPRALGAWPALCCRVRARPAPGQERHL